MHLLFCFLVFYSTSTNFTDPGLILWSLIALYAWWSIFGLCSSTQANCPCTVLGVQCTRQVWISSLLKVRDRVGLCSSQTWYDFVASSCTRSKTNLISKFQFFYVRIVYMFLLCWSASVELHMNNYKSSSSLRKVERVCIRHSYCCVAVYLLRNQLHGKFGPSTQ